jgi:TetR/AcrR family transcriptional regulator, transcriptional repressor of aconitase
MEEIIREAGLSAGAVYLYFKGKDELILTAISSQLIALRELIAPILEGDSLPGSSASPDKSSPNKSSPDKLIRQLTTAIAGFHERMGINQQSVILMCWSEAQTNSKVKTLIRGFQKEYRKALSKQVRKWQKNGLFDSETDADDAAKALLAFFLGFIVQSAMIGDVKPASLARGIAGLMATGLKAGGR